MVICLLWFLLYFCAKLEGDRLAQPAGKYCSIRHKVRNTWNFEPEFLVEWKAPHVSLLKVARACFLPPSGGGGGGGGGVLDRIAGREVHPGRQNLDPL